METTKEQAIAAYTKFLQTKHIASEAIEERVSYIKKLIILIQGEITRTTYGKALQSILQLERTVERQQQLNIAREFFPFLIGDIKAIARYSESYGFDLHAAKFKSLPASLEWETIDALDDESLDEHESKLINDYTLDLKKQNLIDDTIQAKTKLAKLILLRLRDIPIKNNVAYRMAVDVTLPLFNLEDLKQRFLEAVREFFYIWIAKADTSHHIEHKAVS